jgi:Protein of unknown function (DUF3144)
MNKQDEDIFWNLVDQFIENANQACDQSDPGIVSAAMLNAVARFNAFIVANESLDKKEFAEEVDSALNYLTGRYRELLREHLDDYRDNYVQYISNKSADDLENL